MKIKRRKYMLLLCVLSTISIAVPFVVANAKEVCTTEIYYGPDRANDTTYNYSGAGGGQGGLVKGFLSVIDGTADDFVDRSDAERMLKIVVSSGGSHSGGTGDSYGGNGNTSGGGGGGASSIHLESSLIVNAGGGGGGGGATASEIDSCPSGESSAPCTTGQSGKNGTSGGSATRNSSGNGSLNGSNSTGTAGGGGGGGHYGGYGGGNNGGGSGGGMYGESDLSYCDADDLEDETTCAMFSTSSTNSYVTVKVIRESEATI